MWNWLNLNSGGLQFLAILIALLSILFAWIYENRKKYHEKRNLLEAIKLELDFNKKWIEDLIPQGEDAVRYYDPTRADFRLRDDAITYAITNGQSILLSEQQLIKHLINVSHAVRFVNQQIEEQTMVRFSSPEFFSKMSSLVINNPKIVFNWYRDKNTIPNDLKEYADELHLRHQAINDNGFWRQLKPALQSTIPLINKIIDETNQNKWRHFLKK